MLSSSRTVNRPDTLRSGAVNAAAHPPGGADTGLGKRTQNAKSTRQEVEHSRNLLKQGDSPDAIAGIHRVNRDRLRALAG